MPNNHYPIDRNRPGGFRLGRSLENIENGWNQLKAERATIIQMCEGGDPNSADNFVAHPGIYGFQGDDDAAKQAEARAAFLELDSLYGAMNGIAATIEQALARFRS